MGSNNKICVICGADCAGKPRVKDGKGRYYCKSCHERATRKPDDGDGGIGLDDEIFGSTIGATATAQVASAACPQCGQPLADNAMLCVNCGYNRQTGHALHTTAVATSPVSRGGGSGRSSWPVVIGVICLAWGGLYLLFHGAEIAIKLSTTSGSYAAGSIFGNVIVSLVTLYLVIGAIQLLARKPNGPKNLVTWSKVMLVLSILGITCLGILFATMGTSDSTRVAFEAESDVELAVGFVFAGMILLANIGWAIFLMIWFNRNDIEREVANW